MREQSAFYYAARPAEGPAKPDGERRGRWALLWLL